MDAISALWNRKIYFKVISQTFFLILKLISDFPWGGIGSSEFNKNIFPLSIIIIWLSARFSKNIHTFLIHAYLYMLMWDKNVTYGFLRDLMCISVIFFAYCKLKYIFRCWINYVES